MYILTCTCDDIHPARAESASMALTASRTAADQARRSWARSIASDAHSLFHLRMPTTAGPMSRTRSSFSVAAQVFSCPPVRLRQVRGTSGLSTQNVDDHAERGFRPPHWTARLRFHTIKPGQNDSLGRGLLYGCCFNHTPD